MTDALAGINTRRTRQQDRADNRQVRNNAGGFVFQLDDTARLRRFLTLGTQGGTYYVSARDLTEENANVVFRMAENDPVTLVDTIVEVSTKGLAPRQNPVIFALAIAASHGTARGYALSKLSEVCRIGTHLFLFAKYVEQFRGWGRSLRNAVAEWYLGKSPERVAFQAVKYRQREGWSHRDLLRLSHPTAIDPRMKATFDWICHNTYGDGTPHLIEIFRRLQEPGADVVAVMESTKVPLSWEMLPDASLKDPRVWEILLDRGMPPTALMRQLPRLTNLDLLPRTGGRTQEVAERLQNTEALQRGRVHPMNVLVAQRTYASGRSARGSSEWTPTRRIVDALDAAFYNAFAAVEPANKRFMLALDVSGSMAAQIADMPLTCREASAAMALVTMATEPECDVVGFTADRATLISWGYSRNSFLTPLTISPRQRLDDAISTVSGLPFGGTDCALPVTAALANRQEVDCFVVLTDSETWHGSIHPFQALREYREKMGIPARMVVVGMTSSGFTIADPDDPLSLDVAGMDASVPSLISGFAGGAL